MGATDHEFVPLYPGLRVAVPATLELITHYVLKEQEDWFEDEIEFVRGFIRPGMNALDIGANYGVYTLTLGGLVAPTGRVWAFEPTHSTAELLRVSVAANALTTIEVIEAGLSNREGEAKLFVHENAELNTLNPEPGGQARSEIIRLRTLDSCSAELGWKDVVFVKLDAEGEELRILEGGRQFFAEHDPLCMFELKHGSILNLPLVQALKERGFGLYRLVPGLNLLVPFSETVAPDAFLLNLFACSPARAAACSALGRLATVPALAAEIPQFASDPVSTLSSAFPYARDSAEHWSASRAHGEPGRDIVERALGRYLVAHDTNLDPEVRAGALAAAFDDCAQLMQGSPRISRLLTTARVASEMGYRMLAIHTLDAVLSSLDRGTRLDLEEPFLSPNPRFDAIEPGGSLQKWCLAGILEQLERLSHYSSFYTGDASLPRLRAFQELGFEGPEMSRRLHLVETRVRSSSG
ncbi:MAG: FkbM family methyltransferase [Polyangiaceae bacterium]|nr:FkbM family methyltransferase [Polyangiaceae bacterium]